MSGGSSSGGGGGGDPWAWLGLLKWTLSHHDGTKPTGDSPTRMSDEDIAFLEKVMKEGVIDENERMKFILEEFSKAMEYYKSQSEGQRDDKEEEAKDPPDSTHIEDLLQELRDIVEQVDYARAFVSLKGCSYLLGAINATSAVPPNIRNICLGIVATLAQNNPPVQKELMEMGSIKTLSELFVLQSSANPLSTKTKIMQAMSAIVRNFDLTEAVFEQLPQAPALMVQGLSSDPVIANASLRAKTLFFLRAFLTSDNATPARANKFVQAIAMVADSPYLSDDGDCGATITLRESSIALLQQLLERRMAVTLILQRKNFLVSLGVQRIKQMRALTGDEAELTKIELEHWEQFMVLLSRTEPEGEPVDTSSDVVTQK